MQKTDLPLPESPFTFFGSDGKPITATIYRKMKVEVPGWYLPVYQTHDDKGWWWALGEAWCVDHGPFTSEAEMDADLLLANEGDELMKAADIEHTAWESYDV